MTNDDQTRSPVLTGRWRVADEGIFCGTLRIARWDFDTDPSPEFRKQLSEQMCEALNRKAAIDDDASTDCPHAAPHRYCNGCKVTPCPIGLD